MRKFTATSPMPRVHRAKRPRGQKPAGGDAHVVRGNEDGNRRQRVIPLGGEDSSPEGLSRRPAVADPCHFGAQGEQALLANGSSSICVQHTHGL